LPDQPIRRRECSVVYWEIIADNLSKAGSSWDCASAIDSNGERSGLQTRIAATESDAWCVRTKTSMKFADKLSV